MRPLHWTSALALACMLALPCAAALGQATGPASPATSPAKPTVPVKPAPAPVSGPLAWSTLSRPQQDALRPLAPIWGQISQNSKRKWIALSAKYSKLSAAEQATLHGRMAEWATLSNTDRNRARLNFSETRSLSGAEKKAQWEAYQALSPAEKQRLAREAAKRPPIGAAPAVSARARGNLAAVPTTRSANTKPRTAAPLAAAPHPVPAASAMAAPAAAAVGVAQPAPAASVASPPKQ